MRKNVVGSSFTECPICSKDIARTMIDVHVNTCIDSKRDGDYRDDDDFAVDGVDKEGLMIPGDVDEKKDLTKTKQDDVEPRSFDLLDNINKSKTTINNAFEIMKKSAKIAEKLESPSYISGHLVIENFISEEEERAILKAVYDDTEQKFDDRNASGNGHHFGKSWGVQADRARREVYKAIHEIPLAFQELVLEKLRVNDYAYIGLKEFGFACNECNAIEYVKEKGHELRLHVDDRILASDIIVNLSMIGNCTMRYRMNKNHGITIAKTLPRYSLQVQGGKCRFEWEHGIRNEDLIDGKRVSLTFRCSGRGNGKNGLYKDVEFNDSPKTYVNVLGGI